MILPHFLLQFLRLLGYFSVGSWVRFLCHFFPSSPYIHVLSALGVQLLIVMGSFWLDFFDFSLSVLGIGFDWVRVACIFNFVCVGEWVCG